MGMLKVAGGNSIATSNKKKYYDPIKTAEYNAKYYQEHKVDKWGYKGVYGRGTKLDPRRMTANRVTTSPYGKITANPSAGRTPSSRQQTVSQTKPSTAASNDAKVVKNLLARAATMTTAQIKAHKQEILDAYECVKKYNSSSKAETTSTKSTASSTEDLHKRADEILAQGPNKAAIEEKETASKSNKSSSTKSTGSKKGSSSGSGRSSTGSGKGTSSGTSKADIEAQKAKKEEERVKNRAEKTNAKNAKAKTMDAITFDGLNSKGKAAAKKRKDALAKRKSEELARLSEEYKKQIDAISVNYAPGEGSGELSQRISALSEKLKTDKAGIEKTYAKKLADVVSKFLKNPRYTSKDGTTSASSTSKNEKKKEKLIVESKMTGITKDNKKK